MRENQVNKQQKIAFFSLSKDLSVAEREQRKAALWEQYCASGGDPSALPGFHDFGVEDGFLWCPTMEEFREAVMNKTRNPAEKG